MFSSSPQMDYEKTDYQSKKQKKKRAGRREQDLICGVCGLPAMSYHFGGPACSSCRVFFRRAIQNETFPKFKCESDGRCMENFMMEKRCPACRFSKCLQNGMDPRWVLNVEERQKLREKWNESRRIKLNNNKTEDSIERMYDPEPKDASDLLREDELVTIRSLVDVFRDSAFNVRFQDILVDVAENIRWNDPGCYMVTRMTMQKTRLVRFANTLPQISELTYSKREVLLEKSLRQMEVLRSAFEYDIREKCSQEDRKFEDIYETNKLDYLKTKMSGVLLLKFDKFIRSMLKLQLDEPCVLLLIVISLLSSDNIEEITDIGDIESRQEYFTSVLRKYVHWRYGSLSFNVVYAKLLALLTEVQELNMTCDERHYWFDEFQLDYFERKLGRLNPFRSYSLERRDKVFKSAATTHDEKTVDELTPSMNMLRRGTISLYHVISDDALSVGALQEESQSSSTKEELSPKADSGSDLDQCDILCEDLPLASWSPDEFDLSWCAD